MVYLLPGYLSYSPKSSGNAPNTLNSGMSLIPYFDPLMPTNVTALVGQSAFLSCKVRNLGNKTVSLLKIFCCEIYFRGLIRAEKSSGGKYIHVQKNFQKIFFEVENRTDEFGNNLNVSLFHQFMLTYLIAVYFHFDSSRFLVQIIRSINENICNFCIHKRTLVRD